MINAIKKTHSSQRGFTLLEAMIALVIFSISLIGIAGLQAQSLTFSHSAYLRSQATYLVYDMLDRMRANRSAAEAGNYDIALGDTAASATCDGTGSNCNAGAIASADLYAWQQNLSALPSGSGSVTRSVSGGGTIVTITVQWSDKAEKEVDEDATTSNVIVKAEL